MLAWILSGPRLLPGLKTGPLKTPRRTQDYWSRAPSDTEASSQGLEGRGPILKDGGISTSWLFLSGEETEAQVA